MAPKGVTSMTGRDQSEKYSKVAQWSMQGRKLIFRLENYKGWIQERGILRGSIGKVVKRCPVVNATEEK